jgi:hypothetical protein
VLIQQLREPEAPQRSLHHPDEYHHHLIESGGPNPTALPFKSPHVPPFIPFFNPIVRRLLKAGIPTVDNAHSDRRTLADEDVRWADPGLLTVGVRLAEVRCSA